MTATRTEQPPDLPGLTFVKRLGTGGYAEVFLYEQQSPRMRVAVKVLFSEALTDRIRDQFTAEGNAMAALADHPNIVQVFRADVTADGRPYLVMKYYPQRNLLFRARTERLPVAEVLRIGVKVAGAVETAHRAGILHRDIKPANILTSQWGEPGLADFGIATTGNEADDGEGGMSIPWSPPEVVYNTSPGDRTADVYSLGATLWHLLVGHSPFEVPGGDNRTAALMQRIREDAVARTGRDDVPGSLERLLAQAMSKNPADRPPSALALAQSLVGVETEQRWPATAIVVLDSEWGSDDEPAASPSAGPAGGPDLVDADRSDATVARSSSLQDPPTARRPVRTATPAVVDEVATRARRPPRVREGMPDLPAGAGTVPRVATAATGEAGIEPAGDRPAGRGRRTGLLVAASAAVLVAVVGVAVALGSSGGKAPTPTTIAGPAPTIAVPAPGGPTVAGKRVDAGHVEFTWSEPDPQPGDKFAYQETGGALTPTSGTSVTLAVPAPSQVCLTVEVMRGVQVAVSEPTCAGGA